MDVLDEVAGDASDSDGEEEKIPLVVAARPGRRAPRRESRGPLRIFVIVATSGFWHGSFELEAAWRLPEGSSKAIVGLAPARAWHFRGHAESVDDQTSHMHSLAAAVLKGVRAQGFIDYPIEEAAALDEVLSAPVGTVRQVIDVLRHQSVRRMAPFASFDESLLLGDLVDRWTEQGALPPVFACLTQPLAWLVATAGTTIVHSVALTRKVNRRRLLVHGEPSSRRCRRALQQGEIVQCAPQTRKRLFSQLKADLVLDYLRASRDLKSLKKNPRATRNYARLFLGWWGWHPVTSLLGSHHVVQSCFAWDECDLMQFACWWRVTALSAWFRTGRPQAFTYSAMLRRCHEV